MNPAIPSIDQLKEMALPAPVSYAPQTWGWWALLALLIVTLVVLGARRYWQWRRDRYRREALVRLEELQQRSNDLSALRELPELLKRVALSMPSGWNTKPVGASLLAIASGQSTPPLNVMTSSRASSLPQVLRRRRGYCPGMSLRSFTGSCCFFFFAMAVRILMLIASTASENAMAK